MSTPRQYIVHNHLLETYYAKKKKKYVLIVYQVLSSVLGDKSEVPDLKLLTFLFFKNNQRRNLRNVNQNSLFH